MEVQPSDAPTQRVLGVGVDVVEHDRIQSSLEKFGDRFRRRVFTPGEQAYCDLPARRAERYAGRFAVKEAVSKAFGTGIGRDMAWPEIEVCRDPARGAPFVRLHGDAKSFAARRGVERVWISLSHGRGVSVAQALLEGPGMGGT